MDYVLHILILVGIYTILSASLNLISGFTGLVSVAHAAFYGIGAYVVALMALNLHTSFLLNIASAVVAAALLGAVIGIPSLRIRDDYFVISTFAFQVISFSVLRNWVGLTGGPMGLPGIPRPTLAGWVASSNAWFLGLVAVLTALALWVVFRIVRSPYGRVLQAIREDDVFAQVCGKNVAAFKVVVFMVGAGMASIAGALYAYYISFIDPTTFTVTESILIMSIVIIGGAGSLWGPIVGAAVLVSVPEFLRLLNLPASFAANGRQMLYGALLVVFMLFRPQGLVGKYSFRREVNRE